MTSATVPSSRSFTANLPGRRCFGVMVYQIPLRGKIKILDDQN
jgi:hypothetical protein